MTNRISLLHNGLLSPLEGDISPSIFLASNSSKCELCWREACSYKKLCSECIKKCDGCVVESDHEPCPRAKKLRLSRRCGFLLMSGCEKCGGDRVGYKYCEVCKDK